MSTECWTLDAMPEGEREDAWRALLRETHLPWTLHVTDDRDAGPALPDTWIRRRRLGDVDLVDCRCGPCSGDRYPSDVRATAGEYVGVLVVCAGAEVVAQAGSEATLGPGDVVAWDSVRPAGFAVSTPLRKQTLLLPRSRFAELVSRPERVTGRVLPRVAAVELFRSYLRSLATVDLEPAAAAAAGNAAVELLGAALGAAAPGPSALHDALRAKVKGYIDAHLREPDLRPRRIAEANALSLRSLYVLFEEEGDAVAAYVRRRRLAAARADLVRATNQRPVTEIALRWGFSDVAHFSRCFRAQYGYAPSDLRRLARHG